MSFTLHSYNTTRFINECQSVYVCYAGCDALLYFLIVNHRDRTGQRFFFSSTVCHYHNLIQSFCIASHCHLYTRLNRHFLRLHTNIRNHQSFRGTTITVFC